MKGIIFNLLEDVVTDDHGLETWDRLVEVSGASGAYTSLGDYDDGEIQALVAAAAQELAMPEADVLRWFGRRALSRLVDRYPQFFTPHARTLEFVLTINSVVHAELVKLYPERAAPLFSFDRPGSNSLVLTYRSSRRLCHLAEGFIDGAAAHYADQVRIEQPACMHRGDPECRLMLEFGMIG